MAFKIPDFTSKETLMTMAIFVGIAFVLNRVTPGFGDWLRGIGR